MKEKAEGFTLVELVVALAITLLLAVMSVLAVRGLLTVWQRTQGGGVGAIEAKLALDQLERDVQSAFLRNDGLVWWDVRVVGEDELAAHGWELGGRMKPASESERLVPAGAESSIADAHFGRAGVWLRIVSSDYDSGAAASQPLAISYQIARRTMGAGSGSPVGYALFREKMSAKATFENVMGVGFGAATPTALVGVENDDVLASHVVDFGVWAFARDSAGRRVRLFPTVNMVPTAAQFPSDGEPAEVQVMIRVLSDEGATLLHAFETGRIELPTGVSAEAAWWSIVEAHSRVYVRSIEVKARAW